MHDIDNINHVGMAVRDLARTAAQYEVMGFQLTPYSPHSAAWKPGEPLQPQNSGNRCVMFASDYLEILANEDPARPAARIAHFLKRHQGAHIICFNTGDAQAVDDRLRKNGIVTSGVIPLQREIDTAEGMRTAKFERVQLAPDDSPEGYIQAARHLTPQYIYQPRHIVHPNGCTQLSDTIVVADDVEKFGRKFSRYLGQSLHKRSDAYRFEFSAGGALTIISAAQVSELLPGTLLPPVPCIAAVAFRTSNLGALRTRLAENGFTVNEAAGRLIVPAEEASGLAVMFEDSR